MYKHKKKIIKDRAIDFKFVIDQHQFIFNYKQQININYTESKLTTILHMRRIKRLHSCTAFS